MLAVQGKDILWRSQSNAIEMYYNGYNGLFLECWVVLQLMLFTVRSYWATNITINFVTKFATKFATKNEMGLIPILWLNICDQVISRCRCKVTHSIAYQRHFIFLTNATQIAHSNEMVWYPIERVICVCVCELLADADAKLLAQCERTLTLPVLRLQGKCKFLSSFCLFLS